MFELAQHLQNVKEEQSAYFARELHDDLGQELTGIEMLLTILEESYLNNPNNQESIQGLHLELRNQLHVIVDKTRKLTHGLRPKILEFGDLYGAIKTLADDFSPVTGVSIHVGEFTEKIDLGEKRNLAVYRIIQEALNNAVKHSHGDSINISIETAEDVLIFRIQDNGVGFDPNHPAGDKSFGLINMKERAIFCDGDLTIERMQPKGTLISLSVPVGVANSD